MNEKANMKQLHHIGGILLLLCYFAPVFAEVPFNGLLLDRELKPKKGVKIYVNDPRKYTKTDKLGRFGLTDVEPDDSLTLELSKKEKIKIPVEGRLGIRIVLAGDGSANANNDDELANTGFGYVKRREYTGVSSEISGERLRATGSRDILGALKGLVPGLVISGTSGDRSVNIRGIKSLMLSNEPLYVVDGIVVSSIDHISLYDVDHVEVIKDGSQYGSRGANGAIVVTTKTGNSYNKKK